MRGDTGNIHDGGKAIRIAEGDDYGEGDQYDVGSVWSALALLGSLVLLGAVLGGLAVWGLCLWA